MEDCSDIGSGQTADTAKRMRTDDRQERKKERKRHKRPRHEKATSRFSATTWSTFTTQGGRTLPQTLQ